MESPNLTYLDAIAEGDLEFKNKLIKVIKEEFPQEVRMYKNNLKEKKFKLAAENVHKIKHKISILGLSKGYETTTHYEEGLKNQDISLQKPFELILENIAGFIDKL